MTYEEFLEFIPAKCMYETIYDDSDGRTILVIRMLDAYGMVNKLTQPTWFVDSKLNPPQRTWVGLTSNEIDQGLLRTNYAMQTAGVWRDGVEWAIKQLKERNA